MDNKIYTVKSINDYIKRLIESEFLDNVSVKGEVSGVTYHGSGHVYFTLKDESGVIKGVIFKGSRLKGLKFQMKNGDKVVCNGRIEVYSKGGYYQIICNSITADGEGDLYRRYEELKKELEESGMFDSMYKKPLPKYSKKIGVVTAPTGAAIRDIQTVSHRRNPGVQMILYPAIVQGEEAAPSVVKGIKFFENYGVDAIIVGRGGGSIEDLWAFNERIVAEAIFNCPIPIVSAVGHESDTTIADWVADKRAATPSEATELLVWDLNAAKDLVESFNYRLTREMYSRVDKEKEILRRLSLGLRIDGFIDKSRARSERLALKLTALNPVNQLNTQKQYTDELEAKLREAMEAKLSAARDRADLKDMLVRLMGEKLMEAKQRLRLDSAKLDAYSPIKKLSGGYAYVTKEGGKGVMNIDDVNKGDSLTLTMKDGKIMAKVENLVKG